MKPQGLGRSNDTTTIFSLAAPPKHSQHSSRMWCSNVQSSYSHHRFVYSYVAITMFIYFWDILKPSLVQHPGGPEPKPPTLPEVSPAKNRKRKRLLAWARDGWIQLGHQRTNTVLELGTGMFQWKIIIIHFWVRMLVRGIYGTCWNWRISQWISPSLSNTHTHMGSWWYLNGFKQRRWWG